MHPQNLQNLLPNLQELEAKGLVRSVSHQTLPLLVWNYTPVVQFDKLWGDYPILRLCRGLVTDLDGNIVARPYEKFYNYSEYYVSELPIGSENITIESKLDGSLLIVFRFNDQVVYSTRGSFYSDQAIAGAKLFQSLYSEDWIENGITYLFEFIGPENRIVVQYQDNDIVLHGALDTHSGLDIEVEKPFHRVPSYEVKGAIFGDELYQKLISLNIPNEEGFVLKVKEPGTPTWMCKIKFEDYCQLHKIVTGVSNKTVWEMLRDGKSFNDILGIVPDEFYNWLSSVRDDFKMKYSRIHMKSHALYIMAKNRYSTRKEQAFFLKDKAPEYASVVFKMLDGQDYSKTIWNMLKPDKFVQPFVTKGEE